MHNELWRAKSSVKLCIAWMAWNRFAVVFDTLLKNNVEVSIIFDDNPSNKISLVNDLPGAISRFPVKNGNHLMHNKFCIIDDSTLITGNYNWSGNAWNHFENIVIAKNDFKLVRAFMHEF
ncbi:phospholipase D-like domain-containing protein [Ralstonia solanacearum]|uniref:phospholipase D-like domain-containing protein n=1 Tax=Ralstonia solanacearum TaxID=305 RepID=UPI00399D7861